MSMATSLTFSLPDAWVVTLVAVCGACLGSFVGVLVYRLPRGMSVVRPASQCFICDRALRWYENIPLLSYLTLRGRCHKCQTPIGSRAVLLELLMTALSLALWYRLGATVELVLSLPLCAGLLAIVFLDIDHWWVPDVIVVPCAALALTLALTAEGIKGAALGLLPALLVVVVAFSYKRLRGVEGLGMGDIKLLAVLGVWLGPMAGLNTLLLAAVQGALVGGLVLALGGHEAQKPGGEVLAVDDDDWQPPARAIPFGPFLVLGALETLLLPEIFDRLALRLAAALT